MSWRLAKSLVQLQHEVNEAHPDRPKGADGTIGDERHQKEQSDHNPNPPHPGVVTAWDITTADFTIDLAEKLRLMGAAGDARVKYVIYRGKITSAQHAWKWAPYSGYSQHFDHIHLSVSDDPHQYDRTDPWLKATVSEEDILATKDELRQIVQEELAQVVKQMHAEHVLLLHGDANHHSIDSIAAKLNGTKDVA